MPVKAMPSQLLQAHPQKPKIRKPKLLRSNPLRLSLINGGADPSDAPDDEGLYVNYNRRPGVPRFQPDFDNDDEELSDYVKERLRKARELALERYRELQMTT